MFEYANNVYILQIRGSNKLISNIADNISNNHRGSEGTPILWFLREYYGKAVDIWSFGSSLFVLLGGDLPFHGKTDEGTCGRVIHSTVIISKEKKILGSDYPGSHSYPEGGMEQRFAETTYRTRSGAAQMF
jgi:serine/threonine protein kinase